MRTELIRCHFASIRFSLSMLLYAYSPFWNFLTYSHDRRFLCVFPLSFCRSIQDCIVPNDNQTQSHVYNFVLCQFQVKLVIHIQRHVHEFAIVNILIIRRQIYGLRQRVFPIRLLSLLFSISPLTSSPASSYEFHSLPVISGTHIHGLCAQIIKIQSTREIIRHFLAFISPNQRQ